ncbi:unnamed protein product (macronuclear) [Paramecium tetraurelia]|uniref:Uncharacterized protein n=1 Tax=Paramecium tetraurelia TaxID=5888 RepID=A0D5A1_PARTE|nr:uncharacterized protein GSPATT00013665001 [Paramecium tetraurelia]CAK78218.1 unnamed protein product [Paramecium tetraurelia]|eukprot:XP_001445615.1 hypothetical protein (macronuclear) [Paramecium tetraurelia strain d4-2]
MDYHPQKGGYGIPMSGNILSGYKHYYKATNHIRMPYVEETYEFKEEDKQDHVDFTKKEKSGIKIFDDNTLEFECKKLTMQDLEKLDLQQSNITEQGMSTICSSKNCCNITELDLSKNSYNVTDTFLRLIGESQYLVKLETLFLDDSAVSDNGIMFITQPFTKPVDQYTLYATHNLRRTKKHLESTRGMTGQNFNSTAAMTHTSDSQTQFSDSNKFRNFVNHLNKLSLQGLNITDRGLQCISFSQNVRLRYLNLSFTKITDKGIVEYFNSSNSAFLEYLDISHQPITDESIKAFAYSEFCKSLIVFIINSCPLTNESMIHLCNSPNTINMVELNLGTFTKSYMTGDAIRILSEAKYMSALKNLNLDGQPFPEITLLKFIKSPIMNNIEKLSIAKNEDITDSFCGAIYEFYQAEQYKSLKYLNLMKTNITERGVVQLQDLFKLVHSIDNLSSLVKIKEQTRAGIKCFICDRCLQQQDTERDNYRDKKAPINPHNCFICRTRQITTIEYPAKACYGCGKGFQEKTCHLCQKQTGKHQLFRCHLCAIGNNKFKCFNCDRMILAKR